jgi:putative tributyrin esterase
LALIHCDFFSDVLGLSCSMTVILPQNTQRQIGMAGLAPAARHPTLYLLHGLSDDHTTWLRRTSIERYVAPLGLAVVMPAVNRSCYADMRHGLRYWSFISQELPTIARSFFPLSDRRDDNFAAGVSMGGYGAFKLALQKPDAFAAAASLSGCLDMGHRIRHIEPGPFRDEMHSIFGESERFAGSENDLLHLAERLVASGASPPALWACCGGDDFLLDHNRCFRDHAGAVGLPLHYEEDPGFGHTWDYWDLTIQRVLEWLPIDGADR